MESTGYERHIGTVEVNVNSPSREYICISKTSSAVSRFVFLFFPFFYNSELPLMLSENMNEVGA